MAISISRYVDVISAVGGGAVTPMRELKGLIFSTNVLVPVVTDSDLLSFTSSRDVGEYFGTNTEEYQRAVLYFSFISKLASRPQRLAFTRYAKSWSSAVIFGGPALTDVAAWRNLGPQTLNITVGTDTLNVPNIAVSQVTSLADVASAVQGAIRTAVGEGDDHPAFKTATVQYNNVRGAFLFTASNTGANAISVQPSELVTNLGWGAGAIFAPGIDAESPVDAFIRASSADNNFGSFLFTDQAGLTTDQINEVAAENATQNVTYMYCIRVLSRQAAEMSEDLLGTAGAALTLGDDVAQYDDMVPMMILASTNYLNRNSVSTYMFQDVNLSAKVKTNSDADLYDGLRINYVGETKTAGQRIQFYQRGFLTGKTTDIVDMGMYANEMWLKDAVVASILTVLRNSPIVPANAAGKAQIRAIIQSVIDLALTNGTISVGRILSATDRAYIDQLTGDDLAYLTIQSEGYWLNVEIQEIANRSNVREYKAVYLLIYAGNTAIRKVEGSHIIIA